MSVTKRYIEIEAATVEAAIDQGLSKLGLSRTQVQVDILEHPRAGILGFGSRNALIRMTVNADVKLAQDVPGLQVEGGAPAKEKAPEPVKAPVEKAPAPKKASAPVAAAVEPSTPAPAQSDDGEHEKVKQLAIEIVQELLGKMKIQAEVAAKFIAPASSSDEEILWVDIEGRDLSILIGRRSETLNALQYITSLILNKQMGRLVPLMVDVQGYRHRREQQLRQLALRMAEQAVKTGRRQMLEPMTASERRIIHIALRDHADVYSESVGESPSRKVTIIPKKK
ncbi:MAG: Jag N-terminal domain-containing protein [Anaerolineaceae bacterium]|nr:Jag N-terminal domain-containing protein [Anaerolineaceae bacterium]